MAQLVPCSSPSPPPAPSPTIPQPKSPARSSPKAISVVLSWAQPSAQADLSTTYAIDGQNTLASGRSSTGTVTPPWSVKKNIEQGAGIGTGTITPPWRLKDTYYGSPLSQADNPFGTTSASQDGLSYVHIFAGPGGPTQRSTIACLEGLDMLKNMVKNGSVLSFIIDVKMDNPADIYVQMSDKNIADLFVDLFQPKPPVGPNSYAALRFEACGKPVLKILIGMHASIPASLDFPTIFKEIRSSNLSLNPDSEVPVAQLPLTPQKVQGRSPSPLQLDPGSSELLAHGPGNRKTPDSRPRVCGNVHLSIKEQLHRLERNRSERIRRFETLLAKSIERGDSELKIEEVRERITRERRELDKRRAKLNSLKVLETPPGL